MIERDMGGYPEKESETAADVSDRIKGLFRQTAKSKPEDLVIWQNVFRDIIGYNQQLFNVREARERLYENKTLESQKRYEDESFFMKMKDESLLEKIKDDKYNKIYERLYKEVDAMHIVFTSRKEQRIDPLGATIRELNRVRRNVSRPDTTDNE